MHELEAQLAAAAGARQALEERGAARAAEAAELASRLAAAEGRAAEQARGLALLRADLAAQRVEAEDAGRASRASAARWARASCVRVVGSQGGMKVDAHGTPCLHTRRPDRWHRCQGQAVLSPHGS